MRIGYAGFFGKNHSWSYVVQNITRGFLQNGNSVDVVSTNGNEFIPDDLKDNMKDYLSNDYDLSFSYTALKNFPFLLRHSKKNRFGIWASEFAGKNALPTGFAKNHIYADLILPPSNFVKQVFMDSGIPESKMRVVSHGVNIGEIQSAIPYNLKTKKSTKILINLGQIHRRKNLEGSLEIFGKAFSNKDDVCLILKVQDKAPKFCFELSFNSIFSSFKEKFPNHAEVEIIREFIPNIYSLYKSVDITFSASHSEGFGMVPLEGLACGVFPIASKYSGFLDFLNDANSLLIEGNEFKVPANFLYYEPKNGTTAFKPNVDDAVSKLKFAVDSIKDLKEKTKLNIPLVLEKYNWNKISKEILELAK